MRANFALRHTQCRALRSRRSLALLHQFCIQWCGARPLTPQVGSNREQPGDAISKAQVVRDILFAAGAHFEDEYWEGKRNRLTTGRLEDYHSTA